MKTNKLKAFKKRYDDAMLKAINDVKAQFQTEFEDIVKDSMKDNVYLCSGMGATAFYKFNEDFSKDDEIENQFTELVHNME